MTNDALATEAVDPGGGPSLDMNNIEPPEDLDEWAGSPDWSDEPPDDWSPPSYETLMAPAAEVVPAAAQLMDARYLGRDEVDAAGNLVGYRVHYFELYQDREGVETGQILEVGRYHDVVQAEQAYFTGQAEVNSGQLTATELAWAAEDRTQQHGLAATAWQEASVDDLALYDYHVQTLDRTTPDVPDPVLMPLLLQAALSTAGVNPEVLAQQQAQLETQQALVALREIGLEAPPDFNLQRDSFRDQETGDRLISGVFQANPADPSDQCRATLIALTPHKDGLGLQALATEYGSVGSLDEARLNCQVVQAALHEGGTLHALDTLEHLETVRPYEMVPVPELISPLATWSPEIE